MKEKKHRCLENMVMCEWGRFNKEECRTHVCFKCNPLIRMQIPIDEGSDELADSLLYLCEDHHEKEFL